jgi:hypothetical protein
MCRIHNQRNTIQQLVLSLAKLPRDYRTYNDKTNLFQRLLSRRSQRGWGTVELAAKGGAMVQLAKVGLGCLVDVV